MDGQYNFRYPQPLPSILFPQSKLQLRLPMHSLKSSFASQYTMHTIPKFQLFKQSALITFIEQTSRTELLSSESAKENINFVSSAEEKTKTLKMFLYHILSLTGSATKITLELLILWLAAGMFENTIQYYFLGK